MEKSKILAFILGILLLVSVLYIYMDKTSGPTTNPTPEMEKTVTKQPEEEVLVEETPSNIPEESITVSPDSLSDGQKQLLETFGVDTENIVVTPAMIACAEEKVGRERLQEIQNGDTPSFFEGMSLIGCYE